MYNIFKYRPQSHSEASEKHMRIAEKTLRITDLQYANYSTAICEGIICDSHAFLGFNKMRPCMINLSLHSVFALT